MTSIKKIVFILPFILLQQLFAQETTKGFKSLFLNNAFDSSKPYQNQLNPRAVSFVKDYVKKQGAELERMKTWGKSYFRLYDGILKQYKIPTELKYLSVIESHLQSNLVSWAGAVGPWQLMDYEAKRFGLRVGKIDDRKDFTKSTHVACKLINELYKEFGDWLLVVAAYNGGAGRVRGAIKKSGSKDFWNLQNFLLEETRNHVKKFIATHYVFEGKGNIENESIDTKSIDSLISNSIDSIVLNGRYNASILCNYLKIDLNKFETLNPNFEKQLGEGKKYVTKLDKEKVSLFYDKKYIILQESINKLLLEKSK
ncbi:MAG: lytic transglycosylase domain-containing protein [Bacteroidetes bacterium]|nr:lytic transglycosylase domain-containing protein [Bacteroidota bacterium]